MVGAFILIPGGSGLVFSLGGVHLAPVALAFAPLGASLLVATSEEVTLGALKFRFRAIFAEMPFLLTVKAFVFAACLYGIDVHGVRILSTDPFRRPLCMKLRSCYAWTGQVQT